MERDREGLQDKLDNARELFGHYFDRLRIGTPEAIALNDFVEKEAIAEELGRDLDEVNLGRKLNAEEERRRQLLSFQLAEIEMRHNDRIVSCPGYRRAYRTALSILGGYRFAYENVHGSRTFYKETDMRQKVKREMLGRPEI